MFVFLPRVSISRLLNSEGSPAVTLIWRQATAGFQISSGAEMHSSLSQSALERKACRDAWKNQSLRDLYFPE